MDRVDTFFDEDYLTEEVHRQNAIVDTLRRHAIPLKSSGMIFGVDTSMLEDGYGSNLPNLNPRALGEGELPWFYPAGGFVPEIYYGTGDFGPVKEHWQAYLERLTGGKIQGSTTRYTSRWVSVPGNAGFNNPLNNQGTTADTFTLLDYCQILASHAGIVHTKGGPNRESNPGFAQLAELAALAASGKFFMFHNEKGSMNAADPAYFEPNTLVFEQLAQEPYGIRVDSLDEVADIINDAGGKTLNLFINQAVDAYQTYLKEKPSVNRNLIAVIGSERDYWAGDIKERINGQGLEPYFIDDFINPEDGDPMLYLRTLDSAAAVVMYETPVISKDHNPLVAQAVAGYTTMQAIPMLLFSETFQKTQQIEETYPQSHNHRARILRLNEQLSSRFKRFDLRTEYAKNRLLGEFMWNGPFTWAYPASQLTKGIGNLTAITNYRRS